jgi:pSer/pThr/pTyr-binding forkhead associated (FHA) protein
MPASGLVIGRSASCNLRLADRAVSRHHARIRYAQGRWYLQDLGSSGGIYVNDVRETAKSLDNGDRIRIGSSEFEFRI